MGDSRSGVSAGTAGRPDFGSIQELIQRLHDLAAEHERASLDSDSPETAATSTRLAALCREAGDELQRKLDQVRGEDG